MLASHGHPNTQALETEGTHLDSLEDLSDQEKNALQNTPESEYDLANEEQENRALDEELCWASRAASRSYIAQAPRLQLPVIIPQQAPELQASFTRAWAPILQHHDVRIEELCQFIDHLNVCKAASPPLQVLNLASQVVGFVPLSIAQFVSLGVSVASGAATFAVAKARIARYIERANKEYFNPRGLRVRIAKQNFLPQRLQVGEQQLLVPFVLPSNSTQKPIAPQPLRERRLAAMRGMVADLQFDGLPAERREKTMLDKIAAKGLQRKMRRADAKTYKRSMKDIKSIHKVSIKTMEDAQKHGSGFEKEMGKLQAELAKVNLEADEDIRKAKKDKDVRKVEEKRQKDIKKVTEDMEKEKRKAMKKGHFVNDVGLTDHDGNFTKQTLVSQSGQIQMQVPVVGSPRLSEREIKRAKKFMYVVIENIDDPIGGQGSREQEERMVGLI